jgi:hypothetical protein
MSRYTEMLNLKEEEVADMADAYFGYASYLTHAEDQQPDPTETAGCYLISAVYRSLIDPVGSHEAWQRASRYYIGARHPYGKIIAVCALNLELATAPGQEGSIDNSPETQFAETLARQYLAASRGDIYGSEANPAFQGGQLNIPLRSYLNAFTAVREINNNFDRERAYPLLAPVRDLLNRAAELPKQLMTDSYHWDNLDGTFIPYEPEILAACISICVYGRQMNWPMETLIHFAGDGLAVIPLSIATEMVSKS